MITITQRQSEIAEPWYEIEFQMKRWICPAGIPSSLLSDIVDAIQGMDAVLAATSCRLERFAHGFPHETERYVPFHLLEPMKAEFERLEDRLMVSQAETKARWKILLKQYQSEISQLPTEIQAELQSPAECYEMRWRAKEVSLPETTKQFLEGIHAGIVPGGQVKQRSSAAGGSRP